MNAMVSLLFAVAHVSLEASVLIVLLLMLRAAIGRRLSPAVRTALWAMVGLRLLLAVMPGAGVSSRWSIGRAIDQSLAYLDAAPPHPPVHATARATTDLRWVKEPADEIAAARPTAPAAVAEPAAPAASSWPAALVVIWLGGIAVLTAARAGSRARLRRAIAAMEPVTDPLVHRLSAEVAASIELRTPVRLVTTRRLRTPAVFGIRRPTVLLPSGVIESLGERPMRLMLLHELTHLRHRDALTAFVADACRIVHWFNPLVWLACAALHEDRELACDAAVLRQVGAAARLSYGSTLLHILEQVRQRPAHPATLGASAGSLRRLHRRLDMIATFDSRRRSTFGHFCAALTLAGIAFAALTSSPSTAQPASSTPSALADVPTSAATRIYDAAGAIHPSSGAPVVGNNFSAAALAARSLVTRNYDIRDLLVVIPDFNGAGEAQTTQPAVGREKLVAQVVDLICGSVDPGSWKVNGGTIGNVQELDGQLIVTQSPANQAQVEQLLAMLRQGRTLQTNVAARFMTLDADKLPAEVSAFLATSATEPTTQPGTPQGDAAAVPPERMDALLRSLMLQQDARTLTAPSLTLFNGQCAFIRVATDQRYIASFSMTRTTAGERKFEPTMASVQTGVDFSVRSTLSADRKYVTLTLEPKVTRLVRMDTEPFAGDPNEHALRVQKPVLETQQMKTTISVPDGYTCLLRSGPLADESGHPKVLLLLVTPTMIDPSHATTAPATQP